MAGSTLKDVAQETGVSVCVASVVLNGTRGCSVGDTTRQRVIDVAEKLGYRPNRAAQRLVNSGKALLAPPKSIGLISNIEDPLGHAHHIDLAAHARKAIMASRHEIAFTYSMKEIAEPSLFNCWVDASRVGAILSTELLSDNLQKRILERVPRLAMLSCSVATDERTSHITVDFLEATRKAVRYLLSLGHRRIAFLYGSIVSRRVNAYREAMAEAGLAAPDGYVGEYGGPDYAPPNVWAAVDRLLELEERPTAILAGNDDAAMEVLRQLRRRGQRVPRDMSVMGFSDDVFAARTDPPLTTVRLPRQEMARAGVQHLVWQIESNRATPIRSTFPVGIVIRKSCGSLGNRA